jgi:hypothetical protein
VSNLPAAQADDSNRVRLPSWDGAPVPRPREYVGPRRFGYPPIRRSRTDDLAELVGRLEAAIEAFESRVCLCSRCAL